MVTLPDTTPRRITRSVHVTNAGIVVFVGLMVVLVGPLRVPRRAGPSARHRRVGSDLAVLRAALLRRRRTGRGAIGGATSTPRSAGSSHLRPRPGAAVRLREHRVPPPAPPRRPHPELQPAALRPGAPRAAGGVQLHAPREPRRPPPQAVGRATPPATSATRPPVDDPWPSSSSTTTACSACSWRRSSPPACCRSRWRRSCRCSWRGATRRPGSSSPARSAGTSVR